MRRTISRHCMVRWVPAARSPRAGPAVRRCASPCFSGPARAAPPPPRSIAKGRMVAKSEAHRYFAGSGYGMTRRHATRRQALAARQPGPRARAIAMPTERTPRDCAPVAIGERRASAVRDFPGLARAGALGRSSAGKDAPSSRARANGARPEPPGFDGGDAWRRGFLGGVRLPAPAPRPARACRWDSRFHERSSRSRSRPGISPRLHPKRRQVDHFAPRQVEGTPHCPVE